MILRPPISTRTDTLFPYTTLFRSHHDGRSGAFRCAGRCARYSGGLALEIETPLLAACLLQETTKSSQGGKVSVGDWYEPSQCIRSEEHTSELQSLMRISYAVFCLHKKNKTRN